MNFMDYKVRCEWHYRCQFVTNKNITSIAKKNNIKLFCYSFEDEKERSNTVKENRTASLSMDQFLLNCQRWMSVKCVNRDRISYFKKNYCWRCWWYWSMRRNHFALWITWNYLKLETTINVQPIGRFHTIWDSMLWAHQTATTTTAVSHESRIKHLTWLWNETNELNRIKNPFLDFYMYHFNVK